jgi:hypothetical protein
VKCRLFESAAYLGVPAFAESDDFEALRLWAVNYNGWKGIGYRPILSPSLPNCCFGQNGRRRCDANVDTTFRIAASVSCNPDRVERCGDGRQLLVPDRQILSPEQRFGG